MGWVPFVWQVTCLIWFTQQTHVVSSVGPIMQKRKTEAQTQEHHISVVTSKRRKGTHLASDTALFHCIYSSV